MTLENGNKEFGVLKKVTSELAEALDGAKLIMVVIPATGHRTIATACAPYLKDDQIVILIPGRTGGAPYGEFSQVPEQPRDTQKARCRLHPLRGPRGAGGRVGPFLFAYDRGRRAARNGSPAWR